MATSNEELFDMTIRHQIGIRRFSEGEIKRISKLLEVADRDVVKKLRAKLGKIAQKPVSKLTTARLNRLLADIRDTRKVLMGDFRKELSGDLSELSKMEVDFETRMLKSSIPFDVSMAPVSASVLRTVVTARPFQGRFLNQWFQTLEDADKRNLEQAIRLGVVEGESIDTIVRRVVGTRANKFADGVLSTTRRQAQAVVRTAVNHVSNASREELWKENEEIISALRWTSTLDGRTSAICRARDGKFAPIGAKPLPPEAQPLRPPGARPPAHISCRSVMVAVLDGVGVIGERPAVVDTRNRRRREIDFRKISKEKGISIQQVRKQWAKKNIGRVPSETTYEQFLRRQSAKFQDEVLGKTKGRLFRKGGMKVDQFVDRRGNELTLDQLRNTVPEAFETAGVK